MPCFIVCRSSLVYLKENGARVSIKVIVELVTESDCVIFVTFQTWSLSFRTRPIGPAYRVFRFSRYTQGCIYGCCIHGCLYVWLQRHFGCVVPRTDFGIGYCPTFLCCSETRQ